MKKIHISGVLLLLLISTAFTFPRPPHFNVIDCSSQDWVAGVPGGGSGTDYSFRLCVETKERVRFDSVWMKHKAFKIQVVKGKTYKAKTEIMRGDTLVLRFSDVQPGSESGPSAAGKTATALNTHSDKNAPKSYRGEALLRYYVNDKVHYYTILRIRKVPSVNRP
jgi:hypothetical protein